MPKIDRTAALSTLTGKAMELSSDDRHLSAQPALTDAELLHNLQVKQPEALKCLYDRYGSLVDGVSLKVLQSQPEAEDLTQEIFLSLWQRLIDPAKQGHLLRYLIAMTRSRAIDKLRSRTRNLNLVQRWGQNVTAETTDPTPFDRAVVNERSQQVRQALTQLFDRQRQAIELAYDAGLSQSEIARQPNEPLGTVKSWTRQGLLKSSHRPSSKLPSWLLLPILSHPPSSNSLGSAGRLSWVGSRHS